MDKCAPRLGDIWLEVDPRHPRHVMVIGDHGGQPNTVQIQQCFRVPETVGWQTTGPRRWANVSRFNGRRGGYKFEIRSSHSALQQQSGDNNG